MVKFYDDFKQFTKINSVIKRQKYYYSVFLMNKKMIITSTSFNGIWFIYIIKNMYKYYRYNIV